MKCVRHNDRETVAACSKCGAGVCADCEELSQAVKENCGTLCANCYASALEQTRVVLDKERGKRKRRAIINLVCYVLGLVAIAFSLLGLLGFDSGDVIIGYLLCGFYNGYVSFRASQEKYANAERKHGATYVIDESGTVRKQSNLLWHILSFAFGMALGIFVTPIYVVLDFIGASRLKKDVAEFDAEIAKAKSF